MATKETQALDVRKPFNVTQAAYKDFDDDLIRLVQSSIMPAEATNADTYMLLQLAAAYGLDPFAREIWAAKMKGKTGEKGGVQILIGRDGLLTIAERHRGYRGFRNQPVYENDTFEYSSDPREMPDGSFSHVTHTFDVTKDRGALLGAWAEVYREGRPPTFFYAPLSDYLPTSEKKLEYSPWKSMKNVMISKCALATALRLAFRISGLYIEEEMTQAMLPPEEQVYEAMNEPEDEALAARLRLLFQLAEETKPGSFLPGRVRNMMAQCESPDDFVTLREFLEGFIVEHGGTVPEEGTDRVEFEEPEPSGEATEEDAVEEGEFEVVAKEGEQERLITE